MRGLPVSQIFGEEDYEADLSSHSDTKDHHQSVLPSSVIERGQSGWRKKALALLFFYAPLVADQVAQPPLSPSALARDEEFPSPRGVPPLTLLCMRTLLSYYRGSTLFTEELVPYLMPHLRKMLLRWTAVHAPLSNAKLFALCTTNTGMEVADGDHTFPGHVDGELIVVGPQASLPVNYFKEVDVDGEGEPLGPSSATGHFFPPDVSDSIRRIREDAPMGEAAEDFSWDSSSSTQDEPPPLTTLVLVNTPLPVPTLFTLPPTLTHLALLGLPSLTPIHRLPRLLPLLEILDLSYNWWLSQPKIVSMSDESGNGGGSTSDNGSEESGKAKEKRGENLLERTEWTRWSRLRILGLRECGVGHEIVRRVNEGRWVDVEVIGVG